MEILLPTGPATTEPTNGLADNVGTTINLDNCRKTATKEKLPELPWLMGKETTAPPRVAAVQVAKIIDSHHFN